MVRYDNVLIMLWWWLDDSELFYLLAEVLADDTKAIDAILNADKKRLALLEECKRLEQSKGKEVNTERLKEVRVLSNRSQDN